MNIIRSTRGTGDDLKLVTAPVVVASDRHSVGYPEAALLTDIPITEEVSLSTAGLAICSATMLGMRFVRDDAEDSVSLYLCHGLPTQSEEQADQLKSEVRRSIEAGGTPAFVACLLKWNEDNQAIEDVVYNLRASSPGVDGFVAKYFDFADVLFGFRNYRVYTEIVT